VTELPAIKFTSINVYLLFYVVFVHVAVRYMFTHFWILIHVYEISGILTLIATHYLRHTLKLPVTIIRCTVADIRNTRLYVKLLCPLISGNPKLLIKLKPVGITLLNDSLCHLCFCYIEARGWRIWLLEDVRIVCWYNVCTGQVKGVQDVTH